jgi:hypothetical protein
MSTNKLHALFFTAQGAGPDDVSLWTEPVPAPTVSFEDPTIVAERTLGLRVGPFKADGVAHFPLLCSIAGGYQMSEATVRELHARFGAWLDATRDEARAAAEVVTDDDGVRLLKSAGGEWGVAEFDHFHAEQWDDPSWTSDEAEARRAFAKLRGKIVCFGCAVEVTEDESEPATEDGDRYCTKCAAEAREEFEARPYRCVATCEAGACDWEGTGKDAVIEDDEIRCPKCNGEAEEVAPATEATPS